MKIQMDIKEGTFEYLDIFDSLKEKYGNQISELITSVRIIRINEDVYIQKECDIIDPLDCFVMNSAVNFNLKEILDSISEVFDFKKELQKSKNNFELDGNNTLEDYGQLICNLDSYFLLDFIPQFLTNKACEIILKNKKNKEEIMFFDSEQKFTFSKKNLDTFEFIETWDNLKEKFLGKTSSDVIAVDFMHIIGHPFIRLTKKFEKQKKVFLYPVFWFFEGDMQTPVFHHSDSIVKNTNIFLQCGINQVNYLVGDDEYDGDVSFLNGIFTEETLYNEIEKLRIPEI